MIVRVRPRELAAAIKKAAHHKERERGPIRISVKGVLHSTLFPIPAVRVEAFDVPDKVVSYLRMLPDVLLLELTELEYISVDPESEEEPEPLPVEL